jgi:hypothetical protein
VSLLQGWRRSGKDALLRAPSRIFQRRSMRVMSLGRWIAIDF